MPFSATAPWDSYRPMRSRLDIAVGRAYSLWAAQANLLPKGRAVFWRKLYVVRALAFKANIHAVFQANYALNAICRNKTSLEFVTR